MHVERSMHSSLQPNSSVIPSKNDHEKLEVATTYIFYKLRQKKHFNSFHFFYNNLMASELNNILRCMSNHGVVIKTEHTCESLSQRRLKRRSLEAERESRR